MSKPGRSTPHAEVDRALAELSDNALRFARLPVSAKAALLESTLPLFTDIAGQWVRAACRAKGIRVGSPLEAEEWLAGVVPTLREVRLLARSLRQIAVTGNPALGGGVSKQSAGRILVDVFPVGGWERLLYTGIECAVLMEPGLDEAEVRERQANFYRRAEPEGRVSAVLGGGNVSSIPITDALYKLFVEGAVTILKMNPVNAWLGPYLEHGLAPLIAQGFLRVVYGGGDVGEQLCQDARVGQIHITGSNRTFEQIVWGGSEAEQRQRKQQKSPLLAKPISSELGNVSPVAIVPGAYAEAELAFQAKNVVSMVVNNASFNCNAAKLLITAHGWPQRARFLELVQQGLAEVPVRNAYYPGAHERYRSLLGSRTGVHTFGEMSEDTLPWAFVSDLDPERTDEPLFQVEPFCSILSHVELAESRAAEFLGAVTGFCNERVWGTLNAMLIIDPRTEADADVKQALDRAVLELRYGTVGINLWPAVAYAAMSPPWGGHPSSTLENIQSGLGWVHNPYMLGGIEKSILRGPVIPWPKPAWNYDNRLARVIGARLSRFEARPAAWRIPGLVWPALRG